MDEEELESIKEEIGTSTKVNAQDKSPEVVDDS